MTHPLSGIEQGVLKSLFFLYAGGLLAYLGYVASGLPAVRKAATIIAVLAALASLTDLVLRGVASQRLPTASLFEYSLLMIFFAIPAFLAIDWRSSRRGTDLALIGAFLMGLCLLLLLFLFYGLKVGRQTAEPMPPILESYWRTIHVLAGAASYGGILLAFGFALLYLIRLKFRPADTGGKAAIRSRGNWLTRTIPGADTLDHLCYLSVAFSFPFLTLLNVTGAIWAAVSWNRYWGWDPKEVWGLITWLIYAIYLHARLRMEWRGRRIAWIAVIGFGVMIFTFLGVNYLPQFEGSLHSYASGK